MLLPTGIVCAGREAGGVPRLIEVFTATGLPVIHDISSAQLLRTAKVVLQFYDLDGIQRLEVRLSVSLTADPEQSKRVVLRRFQQLLEEDRIRMQRAAKGLAKAMQYGIDRYPAIVFDGETAIYGVTNINEALSRYQTWREGGKQ